MKKLMTTSLGVLAIAVATPALAQSDVTTNWTGPYVGGSLGYSWQPNFDRDTREVVAFDTNNDGAYGDQVRTLPSGGNAFERGFCRGRALGSSPASCSSDKDGRTAWKVHAGYDYQMGNFVVGAVVEGGKSYIQNSVSAFSTTPASYTFTRELSWDGAARLRAGYALPTGTLIYGTGGLAYGKIKNSFSAINNTFNTFTESNRTDKDFGWTAGGGIEQKVANNFSIGVLYKYTRFNDDGYTVNAGQGTPPSAVNAFVNPVFTSGSTNLQRTSDRFENHSVQATASFRF
ncbi:MAG: outer membrane beta-barrel protein [Sphingobium sp.]|uniref:outer membrane protein n=1 Tax=Sphingobium sp. TaxID=1912891 RepID=UPI0029AAEFD7|nr:outer membrane beta-barrel protein [Sphingobium sp.]MDX3910894.1 outer membrane beta-barrel protein [Sphingobium sp.]